jgi:hypothetical protein
MLQNQSDPKVQYKSELDRGPGSKIVTATITADRLVKMNENRTNLNLTEIAKTHENNFFGKDAMVKGPGRLSYTEISAVGVDFVTPRAHPGDEDRKPNQHSSELSMFTSGTATSNSRNAPKNSTEGQKLEPMAIGPRPVLAANHKLHSGPSTDLHKFTWTRVSKDQSSRISVPEHPDAAESKFIKKTNSTVHYYNTENNSHNFNGKVTPTKSTRDTHIGSDFSSTTNCQTPSTIEKTILSSVSGTCPGEKYTNNVNSSGKRTSVGNSERSEQLKETSYTNGIATSVRYVNAGTGSFLVNGTGSGVKDSSKVLSENLNSVSGLKRSDHRTSFYDNNYTMRSSKVTRRATNSNQSTIGSTMNNSVLETSNSVMKDAL